MLTILDAYPPSITGVNDSGALIGAYSNAAPDDLVRAFTYLNGQFSPLGTPPATDTGISEQAFNNSGQIVGGSYDPSSGYYEGNGFFVTTGPYAYIPEFNANAISVFDTTFDLPVASIPGGGGPLSSVVSPNGSSVYVANWGAASVSVINATNYTVTAIIPLGPNPSGITITPDGSTVYVGGASLVYVIDTATNTLKLTISAGLSPGFVAATSDGKYVYVTNGGSNTVSVISTATNSVIATIPVGGAPQALAVRPDGKFVYVPCPSSYAVYVIDTSSNTVAQTIPVSNFPYAVSIAPDGRTGYVSEYYGAATAVIDLASNSVIATVPNGTIPFGSAVTPDGGYVWQANLNSHYIAIISTATNSVVATVPVSGGVYTFSMGTAPATSHSITQLLSPTAPNQFNFGLHSFTVQYPAESSFSGINMTVVAVEANQQAFKQRVAGSSFANATCIVYSGAGGNCVDYQVTCSTLSGSAVSCPSVSTPTISVKTSFDTVQQIVNPGFLTTPIGTNDWTNIFDSFYLMRIDPTMKGRTRGFSEFYAVDLGAGNQEGVGTLGFTGALQPNGSSSFPAGAPISVTFQLASIAHAGTQVSDATAGLTVVMLRDASGNPTSKVVFQQNPAFNYGGSGYTFSLSTTGFAPGVYNLTVYGDAFAAQQVQFKLVAVPGDVNGDGIVNCADLAIVKASFGKKAGQPGFDPRADVNHDGIVNVLDLAFVARQIPAGTSCK